MFPGHPGGGPQRQGRVPAPGQPGPAPAGQALFRGGPRRAPPKPHRHRPVRGLRRPPGPGRGGLQALLSPEKRPGGVHLLHVPRGHGDRRRLGGGGRGHQRHERVGPGRQKQQRRPAGGGGPPGLRRRGAFGRGGLPAADRAGGLPPGRGRLLRPGPAGGGLSGETTHRRLRGGAPHLPARRGPRRFGRLPARFCHRQHAGGPAHLGPPAPRFRLG